MQVNGKKVEWQKGMSVEDLLNDLPDKHPYAVVKINGKYVSRPDFSKTILEEEDEIFLIPLIAGG